MSTLSKLKTLIPFNELERKAQEQIYNALKLPFLKTLAVMPDCHMGYTLPIGAVALLDEIIWPAAVGSDIACGMCCCILKDIPARAIEKQKTKDNIFKRILATIPVGLGVQHEVGVPYEEFKSASGNNKLNDAVNSNLHFQLGTLGASNHFIEIGRSREHDCVGVTIHSGSRRLGYEIADFHIREALSADPDLPRGFLHLDSEAGKAYHADLLFAQQYALDNRKHMMERLLYIILEEYKEAGKDKRFDMRVRKYMAEMINENHNHAIVTPDGVLHRKGATPADKGQLGVIPANMKDGVWITEGLGNEEFLSSSSHGAGRRMSRGDAKRRFDVESHKKQMVGITCNVDNGTLDEDPRAYKDINRVMELQESIVVRTVDHLAPLIVAKGSEKTEKKPIYRCAVCNKTMVNKHGEKLCEIVVDDGLLGKLGYSKAGETSKRLVTFAFCGKCYKEASQ
jgi:tRNA-splicing ligase RtcB (3'-phosphate/5'-hydroxy nucleic acid ligase)